MNTINLNRNDQSPKVKEINLKEIVSVIKRRFWIIALLTVISGIAGFTLNNAAITPLYQSSSRIIIGADEESRKTLQVIIRDSAVLDIVINQMQLNKTAEELANQITVASVDNSQVVSISVVDSNPNQAAILADTVANVFKDEVPKIVGEDYVRVLSKAKVNTNPINPKNNNKLFFAVAVGIVIGIGLAFLLESLDNRIRPNNDLEAMLGLPVLGKVPRISKRNLKRKKNRMYFELETGGESVGGK
ncbi:YveK family protein [Neobacillus sp. LXY-1]|uniref:YveK family protein n=1 Tax=Neobacillus sp. LXY-1 TaxID=3379133 RepID=UPI003EE11191